MERENELGTFVRLNDSGSFEGGEDAPSRKAPDEVVERGAGLQL
jgi:hypothetical protein